MTNLDDWQSSFGHLHSSKQHQHMSLHSGILSRIPRLLGCWNPFTQNFCWFQKLRRAKFLCPNTLLFWNSRSHLNIGVHIQNLIAKFVEEQTLQGLHKESATMSPMGQYWICASPWQITSVMKKH